MNYFSWNAKNELYKYYYHSSILLWLKFRGGALQSGCESNVQNVCLGLTSLLKQILLE